MIWIVFKTIKDIVEYFISFIQEGLTFKNIFGTIFWIIYVGLLFNLNEFTFLTTLTKKVLFYTFLLIFVVHELYKFKQDDYTFSSYIVFIFLFLMGFVTRIEISIIRFIYNLFAR